MAASLEIGNGWQSPRISFTFDFSQTETERTTNDWQSPRISFSLNLSQTDRISPEKRKREDVADVIYDTDFEFCVISNNNNGRSSIRGETLLPIADELFVDGKILPLIHCPVEAQPVSIARHLSLERSRCQSPVRSTSSPPSKIRSCCWGNVASKSLRHKAPNKWKEIMFKLSNKEDARAENRRASSKFLDQDRSGNNCAKQQTSSSTISMWPFTRTCSTGGGEMEGNGLFYSLPCSSIPSPADLKYKAATTGCTYKEIEILPGLVEGSKPLKAWGISNKVQSDPRCLRRNDKEETKIKQTAGRGKQGSPGLPASRIRGGMNSPRTVVGNGRLMVRNLGRSSSTVAEAASFYSPRPGRPMADGYFPPKANSSMGGGVGVSQVLNVPTCIDIGYVGGRRNGGGGLFDLFSKREKKQPQSSAYNHRHYSHASTNRKKGHACALI
jgi:hypothetical protein